MFISMTFENFKCYRSEATLSMEATRVAEHEDSLIVDESGKKYLPVAVLYGPNGGGKSSTLQAFECLWRYITLPWMLMRGQGGRPPKAGCRPYAFDNDSSHEPTTFRIVFGHGGYVYRYILSMLREEVLEEYLHRRKPGKGATATIFERSDGTVSLGSALKRKSVSTKVDSMMPFLSFLAINYDLEPADTAFDWFLRCSFLDYSLPHFERRVYRFDDDERQERVVRMLNAMDIDITGIRYKYDSEDDLEAVYLRHATGSGGELELQEESNGTQKLLSLVPSLINALEDGSVIVSDELDAKLHPKLLKYIVRLFTSRETNPKGAQLIYTSHDMSTLNSAMFRRDEIWFAAKGSSGSSTMYSLADIVDAEGHRIRPQNAYDRQYLAGQYGADPYLRKMMDWGAHVEEA